MMTLYLIFAVPEACAQVYPELKQPVNDFRAKFAKQVSGGNSSAADTVLPKDAQKEITACLNKQSVLSKGQCSRLIEVFSTGLSSENPESQQDEKALVEMETLLKGGRQMIAGCADQKEKQLRQSSH
ncbi:hypothetical protein [Serratia aquatilis]|uniref:hypothetical protein n=1 Tax=Serratia aquatilis TaxID=1737515 RepID=UPI0036D3594A